MIHFRPFRNGDLPTLAKLWNRGVPQRWTARPLTAHEFDSQVVDRPAFEAAGLIVAERDGRAVGFAHAGFGPEDPDGRPQRLGRALGAVGMLVVDSGEVGEGEDEEAADGLIAEAERYLRRRGATVLYGGGQYPLNPFYWGLYGGSEWAGILSAHGSFHRALARAGYEPASTTVLMEADLASPAVHHPKAPLIRRATRFEVVDDPTPRNWWEAQAIGDFRPTLNRLVSKADQTELASAVTWDMSWFGRTDQKSRIGLIHMEVRPEHRRKGYGRHLVAEILKQARTEMTDAVALQTRSTNLPALALYESLGFLPVETATLYRLPAHLMGRTGETLKGE